MKRLALAGIPSALLALAGVAATNEASVVPTTQTHEASVLPTTQTHVALQSASVRLNEDAMPVLTLSLAAPANVQAFRVTTFYSAPDGTRGFQTARVTPAPQVSIPLGSLVLPKDAQVSVGVTHVTTSSAAWTADLVGMAKAAKSGPGATIDGKWHESLEAAQGPGGCGGAFCNSERQACNQTCRLKCVQNFSCTATTCSSSCTCKTVPECNPF